MVAGSINLIQGLDQGESLKTLLKLHLGFSAFNEGKGLEVEAFCSLVSIGMFSSLRGTSTIQESGGGGGSWLRIIGDGPSMRRCQGLSHGLPKWCLFWYKDQQTDLFTGGLRFSTVDYVYVQKRQIYSRNLSTHCCQHEPML